MHETIFNGKANLTAGSSFISVKVDVVRYDTSVEIRIIDTSNIFTLFICTITQSEFYILKRDQDILVDYERFVHILVNLFHSLSLNKLSATFNDGILRFIENSEFRNICKLELKFHKPKDEQYKTYLGDLLSRMESDNVKLIRENAILRDKCVNGDREMRDKLRSLEADLMEARRRMELQAKDYTIIESKLADREDELSKTMNRVFSLENENSQLKYECEKYAKDNKQSYKDQLKDKEEELEASLKEVRIANEIIKKMKQENNEFKTEKDAEIKKLTKEIEKSCELNEKYANINKKFKSLDEKYKNLKDEIKMKNSRLEELESINRGLLKKLENAQNVYNHFYSKKVEETPDNYSDTFTLRPESPPPH